MMATSGDTSWVMTRDTIIEAAMRKVGALALGQSASATELTKGMEALNSALRYLQTLGMPLWKRTETATTLINGTSSYTVSNAVKIPAVYLVSGTTRYELQHKSRYDMLALPNTSGGTPVHWAATPTLNDYTVTVWPTPDATTAANYSLVIVSQKKFDDFTSGSENPDFPAYWMDALIYQLAVRLAPEYGLPLQDRQTLKAEAKEYTDAAADFGDEDGSMFFQPERH